MIKELAKNALVKKQIKKYNKLLAAKSSAYDKWQHDMEKEPVADAVAPISFETAENGEKVPTKLPSPSVKVVPYGKVWEIQSNKNDDNTVYLFVSPKGKLVRKAADVIKQYFIAHPEHNVVYGDEDELGKGGKYIHPFFKPDWSPDSYWVLYRQLLCLQGKGHARLCRRVRQRCQNAWGYGQQKGLH